STDNTLYMRINQTQKVRDHVTMPVKFFVYHGGSFDTISFDNFLRSQSFEKSLGYKIDSLVFDNDALILSKDTLIYAPGLLPSGIRQEADMNSIFIISRDGGELSCKFKPSDERGEIEVYNSVGMKIRSIATSSGESQKKIDIRNFASGIYFVHYTSGSINEIRSVNITK